MLLSNGLKSQQKGLSGRARGRRTRRLPHTARPARCALLAEAASPAPPQEWGSRPADVVSPRRPARPCAARAMTTAHRPTWAAAKGSKMQGGARGFGQSTAVSVKEIYFGKMKTREEGQADQETLAKRDLKVSTRPGPREGDAVAAPLPVHALCCMRRRATRADGAALSTRTGRAAAQGGRA